MIKKSTIGIRDVINKKTGKCGNFPKSGTSPLPPVLEPHVSERKKIMFILHFRTLETLGQKFLNLVDSCFPPDHELRKAVNRNTIKISYSTMPNNVGQHDAADQPTHR